MDKTERVARAICRAKGQNPYADSGRGPMVTTQKRTSSMSTSYSYGPEALPNWRLYEAEAKVFIAAHEAMSHED